jgi:tRNA (Thr-GGU) A37 N-methylase
MSDDATQYKRQTGCVKISSEVSEELRDLGGSLHVHLTYHFHKAGPSRLVVAPFLQGTERGICATRIPSRPNPIRFSIVELVHRERNILHLDCVDVLDGTPLPDITKQRGKCGGTGS